MLAPELPALEGLVSRIAPAIVERQHGRRRRVRDAPARRRSSFAEAIATSDLPGGVVNLLTGFRAELGADARRRTWTSTRSTSPGAGDDTAELEVLAADNVKRVVRAHSEQSPWEISAFLELKTVWHPVGT